MSEISIDGRVALITGAGRGLGRAYALELARRGAAVVVNDPGLNIRGDDVGDRTCADEVTAEITAAGGEAVADYGNVADPKAAAAMVQRAVGAFGTLDIVVNNAGNNRRNTFADTTLEDLRNVIEFTSSARFWLPSRPGRSLPRSVTAASCSRPARSAFTARSTAWPTALQKRV